MRDIDPISGNPCGIQFGPEPPAAASDQCPLCDLSGPHAHTVDELRDLERKAAFLAAKLGVPSQQSKLQACEKDAARYRWLRDPANAEVAETLFLDFNEDGATDTYYSHTGESLDGEIDARIAEAPKS
jgi:hypothetical protein